MTARSTDCLFRARRRSTTEFCTVINRIPDTITVRVKDEGNGFDPSVIPNPLDDQNLLKESGRGIFLIKSMMDKVDFQMTENGTIIEMVIDLKRLK